MKRKRIASIVLMIIMLVAISGCCRGCCKPPKISSVYVKLIPQHRDWWCWAATTEMISDYYGHRIDQCKSVNYVHGTPPDCCTGCTGDCPCWGSAWGANITDMQDNWTHWNFTYSYTASSISWQDLKETISTSSYCLKSPIQVVWWWYPNPGWNGGHVVTAYGYADAGNIRYVSYLNPLPPDCEKSDNSCYSVSGGEDAIITYDAFVDNGVHKWGDSFYGFRYTEP